MNVKISENKIRLIIRKELEEYNNLKLNEADDCNWHLGMLPGDIVDELKKDPDLCEPDDYKGYRSIRSGIDSGKKIFKFDDLPPDEKEFIETLLKSAAIMVKMDIISDISIMAGLSSEKTRKFVSAGMAIAPVPNACFAQLTDSAYWDKKAPWQGEAGVGCTDEEYGNFRTCEALARSLVCGALYYAWHESILKLDKAAMLARIKAIRKIRRFKALAYILEMEAYQKILAIEMTLKTIEDILPDSFMKERVDKFCAIDSFDSAVDTIESEVIEISAEATAIVLKNLGKLTGVPSSPSPSPSPSPGGGSGSPPPRGG